MTWRWYLTIAAVGQYMQLAGLRDELEENNPDFMRAQNDLGAHSLTAIDLRYAAGQLERAAGCVLDKPRQCERVGTDTVA